MTAPLFAGTQNTLGIGYMRFKAGGTIAKNRTVKLDTTEGQVIQTTAITDVVIGVAQASVVVGDDLDVQTVPGTKVLMTAGAAIALGAQLMPDPGGTTHDGEVITAAGATARNCGIALQPAAAAGDQFSALLERHIDGPVQT